MITADYSGQNEWKRSLGETSLDTAVLEVIVLYLFFTSLDYSNSETAHCFSSTFLQLCSACLVFRGGAPL